MKKLVVFFLACLNFACDTEINPTLNPAAEVMVVDAWLNDKNETQKIFLTISQPYFNQSLPEKVEDASVSVIDLSSGETITFIETDAYYAWEPGDEGFLEIGHQYQLLIEVEGVTYTANAGLGPVPEVDSVEFAYNPKDINFKEPYFTAEFLANDIPGQGDAYWIKAWKNGVYLSKPSEINIAYDAGFSSNQTMDGVLFNQIIRKDFVNPWDKNPDNENVLLPPYVVGDSLYLEIHSIDPMAFEFLSGVILQTNRPGGFSELFSTPLANVITNIQPVSGESSTKVQGFFNVSAVTSGGGKLTGAIAEAAMNLEEN
ncbi:DUF4249 family protein [Cyclobacterium amurskyense]|uniref:DUF4249 domain-containing protein n=1 Tax=Cyclobacterium amurskyense TaxID=320787 RepID=A0A0H4PE47_9BACT|nr:DUF4249 family protein [Cyclobacterium amurskyense]AKP52514.1 hypothetical protein CA2015_3114 [Cyclobacterium amurskyense]